MHGATEQIVPTVMTAVALVATVTVTATATVIATTLLALASTDHLLTLIKAPIPILTSVELFSGSSSPFAASAAAVTTETEEVKEITNKTNKLSWLMTEETITIVITELEPLMSSKLILETI